MEKPELLAPGGSLEKLKTAIMYGADAVYIGGEAYSLRVAAENFSEDDMKEGLERGEAVFERFKCGREQQEWLYRGCVEALAPLSDLPMYRELRETVETVFCKRRDSYAGNH